MKTIHIFLASSNELKRDRELFEIEINRKSNLWKSEHITLQLEVWEGFTARMSPTRSQDEYNKEIEAADIFVLLAYSKVGIYTKEEFEIAFGAFKKDKKPFIFTYFKDIDTPDNSLKEFKNTLKELGHFYSPYSTFDSLWNQFNKELDRLLLADLKTNDIALNSIPKIDNTGTSIKNQFNHSSFTNTTFN